MQHAGKRPRTKPPEARRDDLLNAAQRLFLDQGVAPTTIEQITVAAEVAKGTFYLYFSSKDDLRAALGERFARQHLASVESALAQCVEADWRGKLATWAEANVGFYLESLQLHDVLFYENLPPTREGMVDNIVIDHLAEMLQAGAEAGAWTIDNARLTAVFLFSGFHGVVDDAAIARSPIDRGELTQRLQRLCARALGLASA